MPGARGADRQRLRQARAVGLQRLADEARARAGHAAGRARRSGAGCGRGSRTCARRGTPRGRATRGRDAVNACQRAAANTRSMKLSRMPASVRRPSSSTGSRGNASVRAAANSPRPTRPGTAVLAVDAHAHEAARGRAALEHVAVQAERVPAHRLAPARAAPHPRGEILARLLDDEPWRVWVADQADGRRGARRGRSRPRDTPAPTRRTGRGSR